MKILIDFGHPAHFHYFRNFIQIMKEKGHEFVLVARDKEVLHTLLNDLKIPYISRGKGGKSLLCKLIYLFVADFIIYKTAKLFKPDVFLSFASAYAAHVSWLMRKPHIVFDDTEHAKFELMLYSPFSSAILNPKPFWKHFSKKQLFFDGYMELCHLHPKYFQPDRDIVKSYGINLDEHFFIVRFVAWTASHDISQSGLSPDTKKRIISQLENHGRVLISSEGSLPDALEKYRLKIDPAHLHHFLYYASLYIGEGATTASECVILGTPAIYINSLDAGTIKEQSEKYGLISLRNDSCIFDMIAKQLSPDAKDESYKNRINLLREKIDVTAFMVWFVENYPESENIMRNNQEFQYRFN
jgi:uncharacterized protein